LVGGLRVEQTRFFNYGNQLNFDKSNNFIGSSLVVGRRNYTSALPSLNFNYDFSERFVLRLAATRSLARPKFTDASVARTVNDSTQQVTQGNPSLNPYYSTNFDASLEYYTSGLGMFSVGAFHKELKGFIFGETIFNGDAATGYTLVK